MFSLCRLCANCPETTDLTTEICEIEAKLAICCGWNPSKNETQMPKKACNLCVDQLQRSWNFAEQIWAAEKQLNKLLAEQSIEPENESKADEFLSFDTNIKCQDEIKDSNDFDLEVIAPIFENDNNDDDDDDDDYVFGESIEFITNDDPGESTDSNTKENLVKNETENTEKSHMKNDQFLAKLAPCDFLANGRISLNGVEKLEKLHPNMKIISWDDCQYKCDKCRCTIKSPHNLFAHNRSLHPDELLSIELSCFYCDTKHQRECAMNRHITMKHYGHLKFRCPHCTAYYWDTRELTKHSNNHMDVRYKCEVCQKIFMNQSTMYTHCAMKHGTKHRKDTNEEFICDICNKNFRTKSGIKNHLFLHTKRFDHVCDQCGWKFQSKGNLNEHLANVHTTERPIKCDQCPKRFKSKGQMKKHAKLHENVFNFVCAECGRKFQRACALKVHMRIHTGEQPFKCRYCEKSFPHNTTLMTHERAHTNTRPYACTECEYRSTSKGNLNKHMMRAHSIDFRNHSQWNPTHSHLK